MNVLHWVIELKFSNILKAFMWRVFPLLKRLNTTTSLIMMLSSFINRVSRSLRLKFSSNKLHVSRFFIFKCFCNMLAKLSQVSNNLLMLFLGLILLFFLLAMMLLSHFRHVLLDSFSNYLFTRHCIMKRIENALFLFEFVSDCYLISTFILVFDI